MKKALLFSIGLLLTFYASGQIRFIQTNSLQDYETVLKTVKQQEKLLCVAIHKDDGNFRQMFFNGVFKDPSLGKYNSIYTHVAVKDDGEMGLRMQEVFQFEDLPVFLVMNKNEFVLAKLEGTQTAGSLAEIFEANARQPYLYDSLLLGYQAHELNAQQWLKLLDLYALNFDFNSTSLLALEFLNGQSQDALLQKPAIAVLASYGVDLETPYPQLVLRNLESFKKQVPGFSHQAFLRQAMDYNLDLAIRNKDSKLLEKSLELFVKEPIVAKDSLASFKEAIIRSYAYESEDFSLYAAMIKERADALAPGLAANLLFDEAYEITEDHNEGTALEGAYQLAQYSEEKKSAFRARMLKAYIQYLLENETEALYDLKLAKELISNPTELDSANRLESLINGEEKD